MAEFNGDCPKRQAENYEVLADNWDQDCGGCAKCDDGHICHKMLFREPCMRDVTLDDIVKEMGFEEQQKFSIKVHTTIFELPEIGDYL